MAKAVYFYLTREDSLKWLTLIESQHPISYRRTGSYDEAAVPSFRSAAAIEEFGIPRFGDWSRERKYLLLPEDQPFTPRIVPMSIGGPRYFVDQLNNPTSVILAPGGICDDHCILL